jgi:N-acetyl sugar amidotransferase
MKQQVCQRCVMDNVGDPLIVFDENGYCNYCTDALKAKELLYFPNAYGKRKLDDIFYKIKQDCKSKQYDCMLGLSGGLDSSYVAYIGHQYGLRMLAVHIDDGFDAPETTKNISKICDSYNIDLVVEKPDKEQFADLTRAFIRAGVPNIAIPQDNVLLANLYKYAQKNHIKYFLSGNNFALESILQKGNTYDATDKVHIIAIHREYGEIKLDKNLPLYSMFEKRIKYNLFYNIKTICPLNYVEYNALNAFSTLNGTCGFEYYGDKHCESLLTKFMQRYYLPKKFGVDKRKSHYSSMIISGQMTREEALKKLSEPLYDQAELEKDLDSLLKKLSISKKEFGKIMDEPPRQHTEYKTSIINKGTQVLLTIRQKTIGY